jgi:pyridoxine 5'-phosphate synthase PdxJ
VREIERIDLVNGNNNLVLTAQDVLEMSNNVVSGQTRLAVLADSDNSVTTADAGWVAAGQTNYLSQDYNVFNNGNAQLLLHVDADTSGIVA